MIAFYKEKNITRFQSSVLAAAILFSALSLIGGGALSALVGFFVFSAVSFSAVKLGASRSLAKFRIASWLISAACLGEVAVMCKYVSADISDVGKAVPWLMLILCVVVSVFLTVLSVTTLGRFSEIMLIPSLITLVILLVAGGDGGEGLGSAIAGLKVLPFAAAYITLVSRTVIPGDGDASQSLAARSEGLSEKWSRAVPAVLGAAFAAVSYALISLLGISFGLFSSYILWTTGIIASAALLVSPFEIPEQQKQFKALSLSVFALILVGFLILQNEFGSEAVMWGLSAVAFIGVILFLIQKKNG